jgi:hypothetical protein
MGKKAYMVSGLVALIFISALLLLSRFTYIQTDVDDTFHDLAVSNLVSGYFTQLGFMAEDAVVDAYADAIASSFASYINSQSANDYECQQTSVTINNGSRIGWEGCCRYYCNGGDFPSSNPGSNQAENVVLSVCGDLEGLTPPFDPLNTTLITYLDNIKNETESVLIPKGISVQLNSTLVLPTLCSVVGPERNFSVTSTVNFTVNSSLTTRTGSITRIHTVRLIPIELTRTPSVTEYNDFVRIIINDSSDILFNETLHLYTSYGSSPCTLGGDHYPDSSVAAGVLCVQDGSAT